MAAKKTAKAAEEKATEAVETTEEKAIEAVEPTEEKATESVNAVVVEKFRDKNTGSICCVGLGLCLTRERFDEINGVGHFLKEIV